MHGAELALIDRIFDRSSDSVLRISQSFTSSRALKFDQSHLSYCTNIHPAETWEETREMLKNHVLAVRDLLRQRSLIGPEEPFAIGLRLSAVAAEELLEGNHLQEFKQWLDETNTYVFTINGFPYGNFHGTRVKEKVFQPDWTEPARVEYTKNLFRILSVIARPDTGASVSTLPGSHKTFSANEFVIRENLIELADWLESLSQETGHDFHLGLEPEPIGHFENTEETLQFFERLHQDAANSDVVRKRIGLNYDTCHFALEYDDASEALAQLQQAGIRLSKIHLSSALRIDPRDPDAVKAIRAFDEPTYFHQVIAKQAKGGIHRFIDLPYFLDADHDDLEEARIHFHIPLDSEPTPPLMSTRADVEEVLKWKGGNPTACLHYEIETYTWGVLPNEMQRPVEAQIAGEYAWVLGQ